MKTLTIAVPTYNMERWLPVTIESCLWQSHKSIEILIVNDGSTDASGEIADRYAKLDSRVRHIHKPNGGHGSARQRGQDEAAGDFITWLDADDFLDPMFAEKMLETAERDQVDMVCCNAIVFSDKTFNTRRYFPHPAASRLSFSSSPDYWKSKVLWRWIFSLPFLRTGKDGSPFKHPSYKLGQDVCLMFEALPRVKAFSQCPDELYFFRQDHKTSHSSLETEIDHQLAHFLSVKDILVPTGQIKPFVKYLNENYWRDIKAIAPRLADEPRWTERVVELGTSLFAGTEPTWFEASFLAPELKANEKLSGLASAFQSRDADAVRGIIDGLARDAVPDVDKTSLFHTLRRRVKAFFHPASQMTRRMLRELENRAASRM